MKSILNKFLSSTKTLQLINLIFLTFIILLFLHLMFKVNFIVNMDWFFPFTNQQLGFKFDEIFNYYSYQENPLGSNIPHLNDLVFRFLSNFLYLLKFDGAMFQRIYVSLILLITFFSAYYFFLNFVKNDKKDILYIYLAVFFYIFSAVYFNFFTAGWIYVLLYLSLQFLFCNCIFKIYNNNSKIDLILIFWINFISFSQSQSIFWFGLINLYFFLYYFFKEKKNIALKKFLLINLIIILSVILTNFSWLFHNQETFNLSSKEISSYDWARFNAYVNFIDLFIHKNFIFNNFYENVYGGSFFQIFYLINFVPLILIINHLIKEKKISLLIFFGLCCYFTLFLVYTFQDIIRILPFSTIIRDLSRFVVISHLGLTILLFASFQIYKKNKIVVLLLFSILIINFTPFLNHQNSVFMGTNSSLREIPFTKKDEKIIKDINNDKIMIIPSGGHLKLHNTEKFHSIHHDVYDPFAFHSNSTVNFYVSNKSPIFLKELFNDYLEIYSSSNFEDFITFNKVLGIKNILTRRFASSSVSKKFNTLNEEKFKNYCVDLKPKDQSFKFNCKVNGYYPLIFIPNKIYCGEFDLKNHKGKDFTLNVNCGEKTPNKKYFNSKILKIEEGQGYYKIIINNTDEEFYLNLNKKYGNNFVIENNPYFESKHFKSNKFFNAWLIKSNKKKLEITIIDKAEKNYNIKIKLQLIVILSLLLISIYICLKKYKIQRS